jgi:hypothetical protein
VEVLVLGAAAVLLAVALSNRARAASGAQASGAYGPNVLVVPDLSAPSGVTPIAIDPAPYTRVNTYAYQNPADPVATGFVPVPQAPGYSLPSDTAAGGDLPGGPTGPYVLVP